jgi:hypothetical protein
MTTGTPQRQHQRLDASPTLGLAIALIGITDGPIKKAERRDLHGAASTGRVEHNERRVTASLKAAARLTV